MLAALFNDLGGFLNEVLIQRLDIAVAIGLVGQLLFTARFLVQWIASERAGKSVIPFAFWLFSIGGGLILFGYALYRKDIVFILGQGLGVFIYLRNVQLVLRERAANKAG